MHTGVGFTQCDVDRRVSMVSDREIISHEVGRGLGSVGSSRLHSAQVWGVAKSNPGRQASLDIDSNIIISTRCGGVIFDGPPGPRVLRPGRQC